MFKHILIATDGSELSQRAIEYGLALAAAVNANATAVTVTEPRTTAGAGEMATGFPVKEYEKAAAANAAKVFSFVDSAAAKAGIVCDTLHVKDRQVDEGMIVTAEERGCDLIVVASHGYKGWRRMLLGSQANKIVVSSAIPVLVYR